MICLKLCIGYHYALTPSRLAIFALCHPAGPYRPVLNGAWGHEISHTGIWSHSTEVCHTGPLRAISTITRAYDPDHVLLTIHDVRLAIITVR